MGKLSILKLAQSNNTHIHSKTDSYHQEHTCLSVTIRFPLQYLNMRFLRSTCCIIVTELSSISEDTLSIE